ncbi:MAG TPA: LPS assembly protein LptD [Geminicoccaceae bacterium]
MTGRLVRCLLAGILLLGWLWPAGPARALDFGAGPVLLIADRVIYDESAGVVRAEGNVEVTRGPRRLLADMIRYEEAADLMVAEGGVVLLEPTGEALFADRVRLSGDLLNGVVEQLRGRLVDNSLFAASRGQRIQGTRIEMDQATYTPCEVCEESAFDPLWQLRAERIQHDQESQTVRYKNARFELFGVPVLYTPYFSHPDPTIERKSGFLAPSVGSDSELGFTLETPYYFALAPNYDFTFSPIVTSEEGVVLTGEYRHLLEEGEFNLAGSVTYATEAVDNARDTPEGDELRGHVEGEGQFRLAERWQWGYDLAVASDDTYLQRYDFSNKSILNNRVYAERIWERNYLAINGYGFQGLRQSDDQGLIPIVLPLAEAELMSEPWHWGSRLTLDASVLALTRTEGLDTRRASLTGGIEKPWLGPIGDRHRLRAEVRGDAYSTDGNPRTLREDGTNSETRAIPRLSYDWSWPLIGDTFGLTPLIEPVVNASIAPEGVNNEDIPNEDSRDLEFDDSNLFEPNRFPGLDRVEDGGHVSYGMRFGLYGEDGEWLNALFGQSYRFLGDGDVFSPETGLDSDQSDYVGRVDMYPDPWLNIRYRFRLDKNSLDLLRNEVTAFFGPPQLRVDVNYLSLEEDPEAEDFREREEVTAGLLVRPTSRLSVRFQTRRNLEQSRTIAHNVGLVYRNPCLLLVAALEERFTRNRDAGGGTTFTMRVTFQNLGELVADSGLFGL